MAIDSPCIHSIIFVPFRGVLVSGQAKGAKHHGGALQADGELVHQTDGKASTSTVEDGLSPQPALVFRRGAPSARHRKKKSCIFPHASLMPPCPHQFGTLRSFVRGPKAKKGDMSPPESSCVFRREGVEWNQKEMAVEATVVFLCVRT